MRMLTVALTVCCLAFVAFGQTLEWQNTKPAGNHINDTQILPSGDWFLSCNNGQILRSTDDGTTWTITFVDTSHRDIYEATFVDGSTGYLCGVSGLLMKTTDGGSTWDYLDPGVTATLWYTDFIDADTGYVVGASSTLLKTTNGGTTWTPTTLSASTTLYKVHFVSPSTGYIGTGLASLGRLLKTTDYGNTWNSVASYPSTGVVRGIFFFGPDTGWVTSSLYDIYRTTDGGTTWTSQGDYGTGTFYEVKFTTSTDGMAVGNLGDCYTTTDGGATWNFTNIGYRSNVYGLAIEGYLGADPTSAAVLVAGEHGAIASSTDWGVTWNHVAVSATVEDLREIQFIDENIGYASGGSGVTADSLGNILKTTDGGTTWTLLSFNPQFLAYSTEWVDATTGFIGVRGPNGIYKTTDGGATWAQQSPGVMTTTGIWYKIRFADANTGYAGGSSGVMVKTTDGGATWNSVTSGFGTSVIYSMYVFSPETLTIIGSSGKVSLSTDGGATWTPQTLGTTSAMYSVSFLDDNLGFIAGASGRVYKTTDRGTNWVQQTTNLTTTLYSVRFANPDTGWFSGVSGTIYATTDGGTTWEQLTRMVGSDKTLYDINVRGGYVWFAGTGGAILRGQFGGAGDVHDIGVEALTGGSSTPTSHTVAGNVETARGSTNRSSGIELSSPQYLTRTFSGDVALQAIVRNFGTVVENAYQVGWSIDGTPQTPVSNSQDLTVGGTDTLGLVWSSPTTGMHTARAWTILGTDTNPSNDTSAAFMFEVAPSNILFEEVFADSVQPAAWHLVDNDGSGATWEYRQLIVFTSGDTVYPQISRSFWFDNFNSANSSGLIDDWLISPQITAANFDSLFFFAGAIDGSFPDSLKVWISTTGSNVNDFTNLIGYFKVDGPIGTWHKYGFDLSAFSGQNIYIGINYYIVDGGPLGNNSDNLWVDHVIVTGAAAPPIGWTAQTSGITSQFWSVKAVSPSVAWAAASGGNVLRTIDGGTTWTQAGMGNIGTADVYNVDAVSGDLAFVTTTPSATYIFRTTNGGAVWDTVFTQAGGFIDAIHMFDATNGVAYGDPTTAAIWVVLKTSDGGASWSQIAVTPPQLGGEAGTQNGLMALDPDHIWFCASVNGRIYRTTDGGATWASSTFPGATSTTRAIAVWFNDTQYGIASSTNGSGVYNAYRSTDGGATWTAITVGSTTTYNIAIGGSGSLDFWMARSNVVYHSTDRGVTWSQSYTGTGTFYDLDFITVGPTTSGWAVKDNGEIVGYYGTITGVEESQPPLLPDAFTLLQNYPNPFNPTTTIRYSLPKDAAVSLKIYNILGQEVALLRDEVQSTGFYNVTWDGRNTLGMVAASGVYFYRLEARPLDGSASFTGLKKMLFLK